ncbi:MAG: FIST C-terminal domain-containing protein [Pseudomonadota bacterium]|nr:FIST C-terminal domain-containing protein [Pseudomonadota bacterium]
MTEIAAVHTSATDTAVAAQELVSQIREQMSGAPDVMVLFASSSYDATALLTALHAEINPGILVGSSSAGEFAHGSAGVGSASALAIRSDEMKFSAGIGHGVSRDGRSAARDLVSGFQGLEGDYPHRAALVMSDALAGHADALVEELTLRTSGRYVLAGGGAGDDARFAKTHVFLGTGVHTDAAVALEILSHKPIGVGVGHGWEPASPAMRATEVDGMRLIGINGQPAIEAFNTHAAEHGKPFNHSDPMPYFLHNILGIATGDGYRLRVPLAVHEDGSITCAADIPEHAQLHIMRTSNESAFKSAARATDHALAALDGHAPAAALFFDCVATRLRLGEDFANELHTVTGRIEPAKMVGCNTYGQIARAEGQFSGFHNCTAVVLVLPD